MGWKSVPGVGGGGASWGDFTPVWSATGTAPAIGNGNLAARWAQHDETVHVQGLWEAGSTTTFGTGSYRFTLPSEPLVSDETLAWSIGTAYGENLAAQGYILWCRVKWVSAVAYLELGWSDGSGRLTLVGQTSPFTWADGDYITWMLMYETA